MFFPAQTTCVLGPGEAQLSEGEGKSWHGSGVSILSEVLLFSMALR